MRFRQHERGARTLVERTRFGWGAQRPMDVIVTSRGNGIPSESGALAHSFISVEQPNIVISMLKSGDKPLEPVIRCWELEGIDSQATISRPHRYVKYGAAICSSTSKIALVRLHTCGIHHRRRRSARDPAP